MKRRRHTPEQVIRKLREADRLLAEGKDVDEVARHLEVSPQTYHRWRNQFGGMKRRATQRLEPPFPDHEGNKSSVATRLLDTQTAVGMATRRGCVLRREAGGSTISGCGGRGGTRVCGSFFLGARSRCAARVMPAFCPIRPNVLWALDFQFDQTADARTLKLLNVIDEYTRECPAIVVDRNIDADKVVATLDRIAAERGAPARLRFDNGPEFIAAAVADWCRAYQHRETIMCLLQLEESATGATAGSSLH